MKVKLLLLACIAFIIYACPRNNKTVKEAGETSIQSMDIRNILQLIDSSGSGYVYVYDDQTIQSELNHFNRLRSFVSDSVLKELLQIHTERTQSIADSLMKTPVAYMLQASSRVTVYAKPPNPCPRSGSTCLYKSESLSFYSLNLKDSLTITVDNQPIEAESVNYDEQTKIKTIDLKQKIEGNSIRLQKLDENGNVVGTYTESY